MKEELEKLLGGYASDMLDPEERRRLYEAALDEQEVFDALAREQSLRDLLSDPITRRELLEALQDRRPSHRGWFRRPRAWVLAGGLATAAAIVLIVLFPHAERGQLEMPSPAPSSSKGMVSSPSLEAAPSGLVWLFDLPLTLSPSATLALSKKETQPSFRLGEEIRLGFVVDQEATVLVLEKRSDGSVVRLFPESVLSPPTVRPRQEMLIPSSGHANIVVEEPLGLRRVRLAAFPPDINPLALTHAELTAFAKRVTLVEKTYVVIPR